MSYVACCLMSFGEFFGKSFSVIFLAIIKKNVTLKKNKTCLTVEVEAVVVVVRNLNLVDLALVVDLVPVEKLESDLEVQRKPRKKLPFGAFVILRIGKRVGGPNLIPNFAKR